MPTYSHRLRACAHGVPFEVRATSAELLQACMPHLPFGASTDPELPKPATVLHLQAQEPGGGFQLRRAGKLIFSSEDSAAFFDALHAQLMVAVADLCPDRIFLHAGVVAWQGRAILLPGSSHAGKTTLTAELVRAGATYYSDEYALIDAEGMIHPFPRDLQMRRPGRPEQTALPVGRLGGVAGEGAIPPSAVMFVEYAPDAVWSPEPVSPALAALECMKHIPSIRRAPGRAMAALSRVLSQAPASRTQRGEAPETARRILASL